MMLQCNEIAHIKDKLAKNAGKTKKREKNREKAKGNQANPAQKGFKSTELKRGAGKLC